LPFPAFSLVRAISRDGAEAPRPPHGISVDRVLDTLLRGLCPLLGRYGTRNQNRSLWRFGRSDDLDGVAGFCCPDDDGYTARSADDR
jgi:hypothetical protein